ncbi:dapper homolog 1 [Carcharodon carcharias]|uniref:dapper homolog 1 n=1 Tax=Carcharodon carcharias TaxID=13397 RepID=UPI001B7DC5E8|nr:dapper homolog 1 [Carcharodon carcharias]
MLKQTSTLLTLPVNGDRHPIRLEGEIRSREKAEADSDRCRTRDRLEATLAGLGELDFLKHRQEHLVRGAMELLKPSQHTPMLKDEQRKGSQGELYLTPEEKQLEDNILMLRKQLNCLRRRDAGLINQLQELDRQISDLQLDAEKAPNDNLETDSRPSSGFYELSDGASGSLSNSSNSVFSECLSSCHSSTCSCGPPDVSLSITDGRPKSAEDFIGWRDHGEGLLDCQYTGVVRRSFSAPYSSSIDVAADVHPKYQCDLVSKNGNDVYRYPSPLHAVAVQSPMFFHPTTGSVKEEKSQYGVGDLSVAPQLEPVNIECAVPAPQSSSCAPAHPSTMKRLDNYIFGLIQKKIQPVRPNKPRTSLNTDPLKGILRQGSICVRQIACITPCSTELKVFRNVYTHPPTASEISAVSPQRQHLSNDNKDTQTSKIESTNNRITVLQNNINELQTGSLSKKKANVANGLSKCTVVADYQEENGESGACAPKDNSYQCVTVHEEINVVQPPKVVSPKRPTRSPATSLSAEEKSPLDLRSEESSVQSLEDSGQLVNAQFIPAQQQMIKSRKGTKNIKIGKVKNSTLKSRPHCDMAPETNIQTLKQKSKAVPKKCHFSNDVVHVKRNVRRPASKAKKTFHTISENSTLGRQTGARSAKCGGQGRETVLVKSRYKPRVDYRKWKSPVEVSHEEAMRRFRRRNRRVALCHVSTVYTKTNLQNNGVYAFRGSDSEYSAECESLFHSTVADTSEDEQSNYTTNCFGDSESSLSEVDFVGETTSSSDSDESGALVWTQFAQNRPMKASTAELKKPPPKAFVKIKASHNLKKKILRFRSGSLKLMTTV